jgi:hypothetical protein
MRRKTRDVTKIPVKRDQRARFGNARLKKAFVGTAAEFLIVNGTDVVSEVA